MTSGSPAADQPADCTADLEESAKNEPTILLMSSEPELPVEPISGKDLPVTDPDTALAAEVIRNPDNSAETPNNVPPPQCEPVGRSPLIPPEARAIIEDSELTDIFADRKGIINKQRNYIYEKVVVAVVLIEAKLGAPGALEALMHEFDAPPHGRTKDIPHVIIAKCLTPKAARKTEVKRTSEYGHMARIVAHEVGPDQKAIHDWLQEPGLPPGVKGKKKKGYSKLRAFLDASKEYKAEAESQSKEIQEQAMKFVSEQPIPTRFIAEGEIDDETCREQHLDQNGLCIVAMDIESGHYRVREMITRDPVKVRKIFGMRDQREPENGKGHARTELHGHR
jgi:hypothetical protein